MIKAIDTIYRGNFFRSRGEAKWAVFMDAAGVAYEYEPQGFETEAGRYLPDFYLPDLGEWLEIKPRIELVTDYDRQRHQAFAIHNRISILAGQPWPGSYQFWTFDAHDKPWNKGEQWARCCLCGRIQPMRVWSPCQNETAVQCFPCDMNADRLPGWQTPEGAFFHKGDVCCPSEVFNRANGVVNLAFAAARRARFEHGETPK